MPAVRNDAGHLNVMLRSSTPGRRKKPRASQLRSRAMQDCSWHRQTGQGWSRVREVRNSFNVCTTPYRAYTRPRVVLTLVKEM